MDAKEILGLPHMREMRRTIQSLCSEAADTHRSTRGAYARDSVWREATGAESRYDAAVRAYEAERKRLFDLHGVTE